MSLDVYETVSLIDYCFRRIWNASLSTCLQFAVFPAPERPMKTTDWSLRVASMALCADAATAKMCGGMSSTRHSRNMCATWTGGGESTFNTVIS